MWPGPATWRMCLQRVAAYTPLLSQALRLRPQPARPALACAPECLRHDHARRLVAHPRQRLQRLESIGHLAAMPVQQHLLGERGRGVWGRDSVWGQNQAAPRTASRPADPGPGALPS